MEKHRDRITLGLFRKSASQNTRQKDKASAGRHHRTQTSATPNSDVKNVRECACGRGLACTGMTQAFRLLGDPRCYYVELPRFRENPPAYKYVFRNNLRAAYLRHLKKSSPALDISEFDSVQRRYVALHHFHPTVVKAFHENPLTSAQKHKVPISITEHEMRDLDMEISEDDRILSVTGAPTGGYYFVPNYPHENAHEDLKNLIRSEREAREAAKREISGPPKTVAQAPIPTKIEVAPQNSSRTNQEVLEARRAAVQRTVQASTTPAQSPKPAEPPQTDENDDADRSKNLAQPDNQGPDDNRDDSDDKGPENTTEESGDVDKEHSDAEKQVDVTEKHDDTEKEPDGGDDDEPDDKSTEMAAADQTNEDGEFETLVADSTASEFDSLWADESKDSDLEPSGAMKDIESSVSNLDKSTPVIVESENEDIDSSDHEPQKPASSDDGLGEPDVPEVSSAATPPSRQTDHPWDIPKYRRNKTKPELTKVKSSGPAAFIDPSIVTVSSEDQKSTATEESAQPDLEKDGAETTEAPIALDTPKGDTDENSEVALMPSNHVSTPDLKSNDSGVLSRDPPGASLNDEMKPKIISEKSSTPPRAVEEVQGGDDSTGESSSPVSLKFPLPGTDPSMRIQVHNELIAWESKRRAALAQKLEHNREKWKIARDILRGGVEEVEYAERLVLGFAKAGIVFADAMYAIYDDKLLDDAGNTVSSSFLQNRLQKQRQVQEYSIDKSQAETIGEGESALLNSLINVQVELARTVKESSLHMEEELLVEITEMKAKIQSSARELESLGDGIMGELKRSEIEVKNIWDVFDAMVTGDLMEYSTHGSFHGSFHGSYHSGSAHGGSLHTPLSHSSSVHGFSADNASPIISSLNSPLVKSTFRQLGNVEDGWLIETHYKTAVTYQMSVFDMAANELEKLFERIMVLEEDRFRKLHQIMLAFVPRQQRLYTILPRQLKSVLDDLVGLRIDEESLQTVIDQSIRDRSHNHLKRASTHRSSIMNRSRIQSVSDSAEDEVQEIQELFGNPFDSNMILISKLLELKPGGLGGMVNANWKPVLAIITSDGNFHVFELPQSINWTNKTPPEAFQSLYPSMKFDSQAAWAERKGSIVRSLTPSVSLDLRICNFTISNMRKRQFDAVEDRGTQKVGARLLKAVNAGTQRATRCTLRLPSATDTSDWVALLEKTQKEIGSKRSQEKRTSRFRF